MYTMDLMSETSWGCPQVQGVSTWDTGVKIIFSVIFVGNIMLLVDRRGFILVFSPKLWEVVGTYEWCFVSLRVRVEW